MDIKKYDLDGGSKVTVYKVFGDSKYFAIVDSKGRYPKLGFKAKDAGRSEYILVIEGEIIVTLNGERHVLHKDEDILIKDGDEYLVDGVGKAIVFVEDQEGGETKIIEE